VAGVARHLRDPIVCRLSRLDVLVYSDKMGASSAILGVLTLHLWIQPKAPVSNLNRRARVLHDLLIHTADRLARDAGFVNRERQVTGVNCAPTLVFTWIAAPKAATSRIRVTAAAVGLTADASPGRIGSRPRLPRSSSGFWPAPPPR
jgi:hypothetical protein